MEYLKIVFPKKIQEKVEKELQVLRNERKIDRIEINVHYKQIVTPEVHERLNKRLNKSVPEEIKQEFNVI